MKIELGLLRGIFLANLEFTMVAYEFYVRNEKGDKLIGILPERRKDPKRITPESIMNWGRILGDIARIDVKSIYYIQVEVQW
jgi:hypothetical protein